MSKKTYPSPLGKLDVTLDETGAVTAVDFDGNGKPELPTDHPIRKALDAYFSGTADLDAVEVNLGVTDFQQQVLGAIRNIPRGEVRSYAWVAKRIGKPKAARAVGQALGANPVPVVVPCHRVVSSAGLGGYGGGLQRKRQLLEIEGASFEK